MPDTLDVFGVTWTGVTGFKATDSNTSAIKTYVRPDGNINITSSGSTDVSSYATATVSAGTAGTPSASKGTVSNHSISVTPSVTNTTGFITGSTKTGTAVTVTASELASGNKEITSNGTNIDVVGYSTVSVAVPSGGSSKNVQIAQSTTRASTSTYAKCCGDITVATTGTYDVYWDCFRSSTSGTSGSQLYINDAAYGTANTTFTNHAQTNHLSSVSLTANQKVSVYARSRGSNYYAYVGTLVIKQA